MYQKYIGKLFTSIGEFNICGLAINCVLINVFVDPKTRVKPKIDFGKPLHDMSPPLNRDLLNSIVKF